MNLSAPFLVQFFAEQMSAALAYCDYVFGNESEAAALGEKNEWGTDISAIALKLSGKRTCNGCGCGRKLVLALPMRVWSVERPQVKHRSPLWWGAVTWLMVPYKVPTMIVGWVSVFMARIVFLILERLTSASCLGLPRHPATTVITAVPVAVKSLQLTPVNIYFAKLHQV